MSKSLAKDADGVDKILAECHARRPVPPTVGQKIRVEAGQWVDSWYIAPLARIDDTVDLPEDLRERVWANAAYYGVWHVVGASSDAAPGFVALHGLAMRQARGDIERATEAASETYLDVRKRLEDTVGRAVKGRSIPDFRHPGAVGEDNVRHYHLVQTRLRLAGKWEARRRHTELDDRLHDIDWRKEFAAAETRTYSVALHFAALWYVADVRAKTTRSGRVKDIGWWWDMLMHGLDRIKLEALGGDRNDPTEALHRLRLRFRVCQGLSVWLKHWAAGQPYWSQVDFDLPDIENAAALASVREALGQIRPALEIAIQRADLPPQEARALEGTLLRGENVRTSTRHFAGEDPASRWERFTDLGEEIGRDAARQLRGAGGDGSGGGGGGDGHASHGARLAVMARLRMGEVPTPATLATLSAAVQSCPDCVDAWVATCEADRYLQAVRAAEAPARRRLRAPMVAAVLVGAAAMALVVPLALRSPAVEIGLRGSEAAPMVHLDLYVVEDGVVRAERFDATRTYHRGDRIYFSLSADRADERDITVWVAGPEGQTRVGVGTASLDPVRLGGADDAVFYQLEKVGTYVFRASSLGMDQCPKPACAERRVEVVP